MESHRVFRSSLTARDWINFQKRQNSKYFPRKNCEILGGEVGWNLSLSSINAIPSVLLGSKFKLHFTFFDLETKEFFGNTLASEAYLPSHEDGSWTCKVNTTIHFWSKFDLTKTAVVVELVKILVDDKSGVEVFEESVGWVPIPLNLLSGEQSETNQGKLFQIPLLEGTPRLLLFSAIERGKTLGSCQTVFSLKHNDEFARACSRLVPDSCMVDTREIIPGCSRFNSQGKETLKVFDFTTPLESPLTSPVVDIKVKNLHVSLPPNYIETVLAELFQGADDENLLKSLKNMFYIKVAAHNGRREIGGSGKKERMRCLKLSGDTHLQLDTDMIIRDVPEDEFVVLVVSLYLDTSSAEKKDSLYLGWLPLEIFSDDDGGKQINHPLTCGPGRFLDGSPLLNWEALIVEDSNHPSFCPTLYCQIISGPRDSRVLKSLDVVKSAEKKSLDQSVDASVAADNSVSAKEEDVEVSEKLEVPKQQVQATEEKKENISSQNAPSVDKAKHPLVSRDQSPEESEPAIEVPSQEDKSRLSELPPPKPKLQPIITGSKEPSQKPKPRSRPRPAKAPQKPFPEKQIKKVVTVAKAPTRPASKLLQKELGVSRATKAKMKLQDLDIQLPSNAAEGQLRSFPGKQEPDKELSILAKEDMDSKVVNEIVLQILAFKSTSSKPIPESLYFSLNFFDFKESSTSKVALERSGESDIYLFRSAVKGNIVNPEGLTMKFKVDNEDVEGLKERTVKLCTYLLQKKLQLNVWDGKTMFQHGFAMVDLTSLLRQGRDVVEQLQEVEVHKVGELDSEESQRDQDRNESLKLSGLGEEVSENGSKGSLILRLINVGSEKGVKGNANDAINLDDSKRSLLKRPELVMQELNINPNENGSLIHQLIEVEKRRYKRKEKYMGHEISDNYELGYKIRQKLHENVCHVKDMKRENLIKSKLRQKLVGKKMLKARVGEVLFFEQKFSNPRGGNRTFLIETNDPELALVLDADEWAHLRSLKKSKSTSVPEKDILDGKRLFLGSYDECYVPFKYCPLDAVNAVSEKVIFVSLVCEKTGVVESQLEILIEVQPCVTDNTMKLYTSEYSILNRKFQLGLGLTGRQKSNFVSWGAEVQSIVTNDQNVIARLEDSGRSREISIKCSKSESAPQKRDFLIFFYGDKFHSKLLHVWKFCVFTVRKHDITGLTGQTTISSLVVRGGTNSQKVRCFTSHPGEIRVVPEEFTLISESLSEVKLSFSPIIPGTLNARLNIVNVESGNLVQSIMLAARAEDPPVSKTYELQVLAGTTHESKILYENPWPKRKTFTFKPAHPWLVRVQPGQLDLEAHASSVFGVQFRALHLKPGMYETLVFINDVDDNNEDCCRIQIKVLPND